LDNGLRECERAVQLSPGYFLAHDWLAIPLSSLGRFDEALAAMDRAKDLEPLSLVVHHHEAWVNVMAGRFADAARVAGQALELDANYSFGWWWLGIAQTELGQTGEAVRSLERAQAIFGNLQLGQSALGHGYGRAGRREEALTCIQALKKSDSRCVDPYHLALVHAGLGQLDEAIARLTEAFDANSAWLRIYGPHDPRLMPFAEIGGLTICCADGQLIPNRSETPRSLVAVSVILRLPVALDREVGLEPARSRVRKPLSAGWL
jgi:tetratricopeptide (TPR) repeat protein